MITSALAVTDIPTGITLGHAGRHFDPAGRQSEMPRVTKFKIQCHDFNVKEVNVNALINENKPVWHEERETNNLLDEM